MSNSIITFTTDFGSSDHLAGTMKGVVLTINPAVTMVDINHQVAPFDILDGALSIGAAYRFFPPRTIHVVVVDPGVGTQRRPLLVIADKYYFVAPDNGVLSLVYARESCVVRHITAQHYFLNPIAPTFHGRDVFAPVAAWLAKTWQPEAFGEEITDYVRFSLPKPKTEAGKLKGVVLRVDAFGNLMTNFTADDLPANGAAGEISLSLNGKQVQKLVPTFASGNPGEPVALLGSAGFLEIAVNRGNAARVMGAHRGAEIVLDSARSET